MLALDAKPSRVVDFGGVDVTTAGGDEADVDGGPSVWARRKNDVAGGKPMRIDLPFPAPGGGPPSAHAPAITPKPSGGIRRREDIVGTPGGCCV
jgi:hypothetical protein